MRDPVPDPYSKLGSAIAWKTKLARSFATAIFQSLDQASASFISLLSVDQCEP